MAAPTLRKTSARLDLFSLRLFLTVCEVESINKAAEREGIAASAITKRIQDMEDLFGVTLLYRNRKATVPTPVGAALMQHAQAILRAVEDTRIGMSEFAQGVRGHIRVSAIPSAIVATLAADLRHFMELHPQVEIALKEELNPAVLHSVQTGTADLGIVAMPSQPDRAFNTVSYYPDELVALLPASHPLATRKQVGYPELLNLDFIALAENSSIMQILYKEASELGRTLQPRYFAESNLVAFALVHAGWGVTIVPRGILASCPYPDSVVSVKLSERWATRHLCTCTRKGDALPLQVRELLAFLKERGNSSMQA